MKTKTLIISAFFTLWLSAGFSQSHLNYYLEFNGGPDQLTAMSTTEAELSENNIESKNSGAIITSFPEFVTTNDYTDVNAYIYSNMEFPEEARLAGRSGLVKVRFDIYENGSIGNIDILDSPDKSFDNEVMRLLDEMPNWKPAFSGTSPIKSRYQLNINFSLR